MSGDDRIGAGEMCEKCDIRGLEL